MSNSTIKQNFDLTNNNSNYDHVQSGRHRDMSGRKPDQIEDLGKIVDMNTSGTRTDIVANNNSMKHLQNIFMLKIFGTNG